MKAIPNFYNIKFTQRITLLLCAFLLCLIMTTMLNTLILSVIGSSNLLYINLSILTQNLLTFILPVVIAVAFITPKPATFLQLDKIPSLKTFLLVIAVYIAMTPALNYIVDWNNNISLPKSMAGIEIFMRNAENAALAVTSMILEQNNIIVSILLVGCLTGLGEEVFFRGGLQQIFLSRPMNIHIAIWITAFIFSALHFQFFGFFPRLLLGALFGYLAYWSGSLWTAIFAHALNNSTTIIAHEINKQNGFNLDNLGVPQSGEIPWLAIISLLVSIAIIYIYLKTTKQQKNPL